MEFKYFFIIFLYFSPVYKNSEIGTLSYKDFSVNKLSFFFLERTSTSSIIDHICWKILKIFGRFPNNHSLI